MYLNQNERGVYLSPTSDTHSNSRSFTNDAEYVEYDMDDSQTSSMTGEYVLSSSTPQHNQNQPIKPRKPVIQDIYDEDDYTLARPDQYGYDAVKPEQKKEVEKKDSDTSSGGTRCCNLTKNKKIIICSLSILLILCTVGGVVSYFILSKEGKLTILSIS